MIPSEMLIHEHKIIQLVLNGVQKEVAFIKDTGKINIEKLEKLIDFFQTFMDCCHHVKEERYLFPAMKKHGFFKEGEPITFLLEHKEARQMVLLIVGKVPQAKMGKLQAADDVATLFQNLIELFHRHMDREDHILFPTADQILTPQEQEEIAQAFEKVETEELGPGVHEKYHHLAHELGES